MGYSVAARESRRWGREPWKRGYTWYWWERAGRGRPDAGEDGGKRDSFRLLRVFCRESVSPS